MLQRADAAARDGHWVVLVVGYEAAPAWDAAFRVQAPVRNATPLAWAAVHDAPLPACEGLVTVLAELSEGVPLHWTPHLDAAEFAARIDALLAQIAAGDTHQVTFRAQLVEAGEIRERVLTRDDLRRATRVWLVNSLRGWIAAQVVDA